MSTPPDDLSSILDHISTSLPDTKHLNVQTEELVKPPEPKPVHKFQNSHPEPDYSWKYAKDVFDEDDEEDEDDDEEEDEEEEEYPYDPDRMQNDFVQLSTSKGGKKAYKKNRGRQTGIRRKDLSNYSFEYQIKRILFNNYDKTTRPVRNDSTTTTLFLGMSLYHILDTVGRW